MAQWVSKNGLMQRSKSMSATIAGNRERHRLASVMPLRTICVVPPPHRRLRLLRRSAKFRQSRFKRVAFVILQLTFYPIHRLTGRIVRHPPHHNEDASSATWRLIFDAFPYLEAYGSPLKRIILLYRFDFALSGGMSGFSQKVLDPHRPIRESSRLWVHL